MIEIGKPFVGKTSQQEEETFTSNCASLLELVVLSILVRLVGQASVYTVH